jgi:hypothetical protein
MELQELKDLLAAEPHLYEYREADGGLYISNKRFNSEIHASYQAITDNDWPAIRSQTVAGRDVLHITRVTGYFTIIEGWNKGKIGELRDRYHSIVTGENDAPSR